MHLDVHSSPVPVTAEIDTVLYDAAPTIKPVPCLGHNIRRLTTFRLSSIRWRLISNDLVCDKVETTPSLAPHSKDYFRVPGIPFLSTQPQLSPAASFDATAALIRVVAFPLSPLRIRQFPFSLPCEQLRVRPHTCRFLSTQVRLASFSVAPLPRGTEALCCFQQRSSLTLRFS
jgi:hypothetical protein